MSKILAVAENFAFGPIGTLLTVCRHLFKNHQVSFVGYGTSLQLAKLEPFSEVVELDTDSSAFPALAKGLFVANDVLLSCMDRSSILLAQSLGLPTIWLDALFWWWDELPDFVLNVDCYVKQNTLKDARNVSKYANRIRKLHSVGPIIDLTVLDAKKKKNQVMVTYGGMEAEGWYEVGKDTNYPYTITDLLVSRVDFSRYDRVIFTGNERIVRELDKKYGSDIFVFKTMPHYDFVQELASSAVVLMAPGLQSPLESFSYHVPTIFLPPSNSSQYVQLDHFVEQGCANTAIHFRDHYSGLDLLGRNLKTIMKEFMVQLNVYENDLEAQRSDAQKIEQFLNDSSLLLQQVDSQDAYIDQLGGNGLAPTIRIIEQFITNVKR